jgi:rRNA-processing protein FCF1
MKLLINDANILIDIVKLDIVEAFLSLDFNLHTTDFVFSELKKSQQESLTSANLQIIKTESLDDFTGIMMLMNSHIGLSFEDCSVWHYALKMNGVLISGDGLLRKNARISGVEVRGIIFIIEEMKIQAKLPCRDCIQKLEELKSINDRLPKHEIDKRIQDWLHLQP